MEYCRDIGATGSMFSILIQHYEKFQKFLQKGTACGGLCTILLDYGLSSWNDFSSDIGHVEMQVLGLLGKLLSGLLMKWFYRNAEDQIRHVEGISVVKKVVELLNVETDPLDLLGWTTDIFGEEMGASSTTLQAPRQALKEPVQGDDGGLYPDQCGCAGAPVQEIF